MAEAESLKIDVGVLRSEMTLQLHTKQALRLWNGRRATKGQYGILGLSGFLAITNRINTGSKQDDPYSDWFMLQIEAKIDQVNAQLKKLHAQVNAVFSQAPSTLTIAQNVNIKPASFPIFASSHLGYLAIYILAAYDDIVRKILLASHIALIDLSQVNFWFEQGDHYLRSLFTLATNYRYSGTTRQDFKQKNAAAMTAIEKYGEVPPEIMDGTRRSRFSPPLRTNQGDVTHETDETEDEILPVIIPVVTELNPDELQNREPIALDEEDDDEDSEQ